MKALSKPALDSNDIKHLKHCLTLAEEAVDAGDEAFGSILVNADGQVIAEARNRVNEKNALAHPEIELADWALNNLSIQERQSTYMYTTGEHCPMCAAAHGWAELGTVIYLSSAKQLGQWKKEFATAEAPIIFIPVQDIVKSINVKGPAKGKLLEQIKSLHRRYYLHQQ